MLLVKKEELLKLFNLKFGDFVTVEGETYEVGYNDYCSEVVLRNETTEESLSALCDEYYDIIKCPLTIQEKELIEEIFMFLRKIYKDDNIFTIIKTNEHIDFYINKNTFVFSYNFKKGMFEKLKKYQHYTAEDLNIQIFLKK